MCVCALFFLFFQLNWWCCEWAWNALKNSWFGWRKHENLHWGLFKMWYRKRRRNCSIIYSRPVTCMWFKCVYAYILPWHVWLMHFFCQSLLSYSHLKCTSIKLRVKICARAPALSLFLFLSPALTLWMSLSFESQCLPSHSSCELWNVIRLTCIFFPSLFHNIDNMKYALNACTHTHSNDIYIWMVFWLAERCGIAWLRPKNVEVERERWRVRMRANIYESPFNEFNSNSYIFLKNTASKFYYLHEQATE